MKDVVVFFIVGGSGCGKGTQCQKLKAEFPLTHISSGDLLRAEETSGSSLGMELRKIMEYGELVPMMTVLTMIQNAMQKAIEGGARGFLIDGYPRDEQQGAMFESLIHPCHACIFYDASNQTMFKRMMQRGRHDDNELTVTEKLKTFQLHSGAVLDYYKKRQKLIEIDAEASPDKVFERSLEGLQKSLLKDLTVIFVLGGPASGKDVKSLCEKLKEAFNLSHISIAELVKNEIESKSDLGRQLKAWEYGKGWP